MDLQELSSVVDIVQGVVTSAAIMVGGTWALLRFYREREAVPRLQWELELRRIAATEGAVLIEVTANIENKGKVRHEIRSFAAELSLIHAANLTGAREALSYEPGSTVVTVSLMPKASEYTFIEPGVSARYCELVVLPVGATAVYAYARFDYGRGPEYDENEYTLRL